MNVPSSATKQTKLAPLSDKASGAEVVLLQNGNAKDTNQSLCRQSLNMHLAGQVRIDGPG